MVDRQKLETILARRFPGSTREQIAAAANAIVALVEESDPADRQRRKSAVLEEQWYERTHGR
jgi:hypothetical protein